MNICFALEKQTKHLCTLRINKHTHTHIIQFTVKFSFSILSSSSFRTKKKILFSISVNQFIPNVVVDDIKTHFFSTSRIYSLIMMIMVNEWMINMNLLLTNKSFIHFFYLTYIFSQSLISLVSRKTTEKKSSQFWLARLDSVSCLMAR